MTAEVADGKFQTNAEPADQGAEMRSVVDQGAEMRSVVVDDGSEVLDQNAVGQPTRRPLERPLMSYLNWGPCTHRRSFCGLVAAATLLFVVLMTRLIASQDNNEDDDGSFSSTFDTATTHRAKLALQRCSADAPWTIHGLWPHDTYCRDGSFDVSGISSLEDQLDVYWPSCQNMNSVDFWAHEYQKHGTCMPWTEWQYFKNVMSVFEGRAWATQCNAQPGSRLTCNVWYDCQDSSSCNGNCCSLAST